MTDEEVEAAVGKVLRHPFVGDEASRLIEWMARTVVDLRRRLDQMEAKPDG
jgi:hypothetical protein